MGSTAIRGGRRLPADREWPMGIIEGVAPAAAADVPYVPDERAVVRKAAVRLLPFLFFLYIIAYLDRVNVGFAKLAMNDLPWFTEAVYGTGAGIFFFGYFLFEVPS
ncbi:MAG TPA: hypothetical protein VM490_26000, partial [Armatimonadaceae bacterium]|nr:hypothetical protein [Armatimonadaceae bacterium]